MNSEQHNGPTLNGSQPVIDAKPIATKTAVLSKLRSGIDSDFAIDETPDLESPDSTVGSNGDRHSDALNNHVNCLKNGSLDAYDPDQRMDESEPISGLVHIAQQTVRSVSPSDSNEDTVTDPQYPMVNGIIAYHKDLADENESSLMDCENQSIPDAQMDMEPIDVFTKTEPILRNDIRSDFTETDDQITVYLYVKGVDKVDLVLTEDSFEVKFKTKNNAESDPGYVVRKTLRGKIFPEQCVHKLSATKIELKLKKQPSTFKWNSLEASSPSTDKSVMAYTGPELPSKLESSIGDNSWQPIVSSTNDFNTDLETSGNFRICDPSTSSEGKELVLVPDDKPTPAPVKEVVQKLIGFTGLQNLGNTCFMNSVIQCLSNTDPFRDYFVSNQYASDINKSNPLGSGGVIARVFADTLMQLWAGTERSIAPHKLKDKMGDRCPTFSNYLQQDAQEFCVFFLDALHEDLNRVRQRPTISDDNNEDSNEPTDDNILADKSWHSYGLMNDSIVTQLFYGQYKSKLVCPVCGKISVTFDPFVYLSLPLPKPKLEYEVYFFKRDANGMSSSRPKKYTVKLAKDSPVSSLLDEMSRITGVKPSSMRCVQSKQNGLVEKFLQPNWTLNKPDTGKYLLVFELMVPKPDEEVSEFIVIQRLSEPVRSESCAKCDKHEGWDNVELKACTKCYRVGYCDKQCQTDHWTVHRKDCTYRPEPMAVPFVISVSKQSLTYRNLCAIVYSYARHSVRLSTNLPLNLNEFPIPPPFKLRVYRDKTAGDSEELIEPQENDDETNRFDQTLEIKHYYIAMDWINTKNFGENYVGVETQLGIDAQTDYLTLNDSSDDIDLEDCLQLHTQPEKLTADNPWYCPKCKESREATKQITLWRLPHFLVIQLKRFSFKNILWREKLDSKVNYPIQGLDMSPFYVRTDQNPDFAPIYDLYAVVNHYGGLFGGHYTAFAKTSNEFRNLDWRCFDDSHVEAIDKERVVSRNAYMLFYKLRD